MRSAGAPSDRRRSHGRVPPRIAHACCARIAPMCSEAIIELYERHARDFDRDRGRSLWEQAWLDRFLSYLAPASIVLDIGCGMGEPIARYFIEAGFGVIGIDSSPSMREICLERLPHADWL